MSPSPPRRARGFTLVELLIAVAVSAILLTAIFGVVQSQQAAYFQGSLQREAQGSARAALAYLEQRLSIAGYGMDASLAFEFNTLFRPSLPCPADASPCDRDRTDGNDELVFYARNPRYWVPEDRTSAVEPRGNAWRVVQVGACAVRLDARDGDVFEKGRILQVVCKDGARYLYVTVSRTTPVPVGANPAGFQVPIDPTNGPDPFRRQDLALLEGCFGSGAARAFQIDRFRFHVRPVRTTSGYEPYLVLDRGLDLNGDGPDDAEEIVVAAGIESFQVGYVMTNAALLPRGTEPGTRIVFTQQDGVAGASSGTGMSILEFPGALNPGQWEYEPTSWYRYAVGPTPSVAAERMTDHQGNIRAVRLAIVARGHEPEPARQRSEVLLPILNQDALPAWIDPKVPYNRARVETTVLVRNMTSRGMNDF